MTRIGFALVGLILAAGLAAAARPQSAAQQGLQAEQGEFRWVDVTLDTGGEYLAAWQIELVDTKNVARIVGVEGGDHPAFAAPPYYDARALQHGRIVLAAFQTAGELPAGRVRVARVHVEVEEAATPAFEVHLVAAADAQGREFPARVELGP